MRVSIHAPAWGATPVRSLIGSPASKFQSTPPRGGRRVAQPASMATRLFQSTPPRGGRPRWCRRWCAGSKFQSTPPRGGRPGSDLGTSDLAIVSIHAPAWGATQCSPGRALAGESFNPRPRVGGDTAVVAGKASVPVSIHAPAWGATASVTFEAVFLDVSIHAPAWGATFARCRTAFAPSGFNPRPRVGGDWPPWRPGT